MANVLIIDDEQAIRDFLAELVQQVGHEAVCAGNRADGLRLAHESDFDVIFLDVYLPDGSGLDLMPLFGALPSKPEIIIMTGLGDPDGAELALRNGAWDYLQKPLSPKAIILPLRRVLQYRDQLRRQEPRRSALRHDGIVGSGAAIKACLDQLASAALGQAAVLITGETGTGKELFARCLHDNSPRAGKSFVVVDCTNVPINLMETMLFGHEKGAFTGADQQREGLIHAADGGTLFLDEIGDMPLSLQKKLLRVLQDKKYRRLGSASEEHSDFRLVAATNRDLQALVEQGKFRSDLFYRIQAISLPLPPLRERLEDIKELTAHILDKLYKRDGLVPKNVAADFMQTLMGYDWPGNVRQLCNILESALAHALEAPELFARHLPDEVRIGSLRLALAQNGKKDTPKDAPEGLPTDFPTYKTYRSEALKNIEKAYFTRLLEAAGGDLEKACVLSGLGKSRLYDMLRQCGLRRCFIQ